MKKTLITLLALGGLAMGATTTVTNLNDDFEGDNVTYTAPSTEGGEGSFSGDGIYAAGGGDLAHAALTFTLNLTELSKLTTETTFVTVDTSKDLGLVWTQYDNKWGISGKFDGDAWANSGGAFVSYDTLLKSAWSVTDNDTDVFITLTMTVANIKNNGAGSNGGEQLYAAGTTTSYFSDAANLGTTNNTTISAIKFNTSVIENAALTSGWVDGASASALGTTLEKNFTDAHGGKIAAIPEPTTATLSLLALCGLAVRRRRK